MTQSECACGRPTHSSVACERCTRTLTKALDNIPCYFGDLETLRRRQTRFGSRSGGRSPEKPLGFDARFDLDGAGTQIEALTRQAVTAWTGRLLQERPPLAGPLCAESCLHRSCADVRRRAMPRLSVAGCCEYLKRQSRYIATRTYVDEMLDVMLDVERRLRRLVDRPAERWYAGICGSTTDFDDGSSEMCLRELYATPFARSVRCSACGCEYDVPARREALLSEAEDREATLESIVRIVTTLGDVKVSSAKISARVRQWAHRGKLTAHGKRVVDGRERPTYRVGDVLDLLAEDTREKAG